mmetsp:Transcript_20862/g.31462  ORF Transcript_20862/g.31462 Transcript_20862/m.31462 type:complete len:82 (+) Transcript_20862:1136-1381(+)
MVRRMERAMVNLGRCPMKPPTLAKKPKMELSMRLPITSIQEDMMNDDDDMQFDILIHFFFLHLRYCLLNERMYVQGTTYSL